MGDILKERQMAKIKVYTQAMCGYCTAAKSLLKKKGADYEEIDVTFAPNKRKAMSRIAGGKTSTPQIFIGDHHVGGCDDLFALEQAGKLDPLLKKAPA